MEQYEFSRKLTVKKRYDVIVAGGGVAGVAAAVSVAKRGKSVLLLEKSNILGGLGTLGLVNYFVPMCNGRGKQIIFGLAEKWLRASAEYGYDTIPDEWKNGEPKEPATARYYQQYSPYIFALQLTEEVKNAAVDLLFDCTATYPVMDGRHCTGVITDSKSGLELYACKMLIDTTGDADLLRRSGMPTVAGENFYSYFGKQITLDGCRKAAEKGDIRYAYGTVCGGGRYDNLISQLGGTPTCGVGFGMGIERLLMLMEAENVIIPERENVKLYIATMGYAAYKKAFEIVSALRDKGVKAEVDHAGRGIKAQFKYADKIHAENVVTLGENELASGIAQIKHMADGSLKEVKIDEISLYFAK